MVHTYLFKHWELNKINGFGKPEPGDMIDAMPLDDWKKPCRWYGPGTVEPYKTIFCTGHKLTGML